LGHKLGVKPPEKYQVVLEQVLRSNEELEAHNRHEFQPNDKAVPAIRPATAHSNLLVTFAVGLLMLVIGVLAGYFGRPLVTSQPLSPTTVASTDTGSRPVASDSNPSAGNSSGPSLMDGVIAQTRHFKGDPNAPITIIEFGDFQ
jgi:hypothetical protein